MIITLTYLSFLVAQQFVLCELYASSSAPAAGTAAAVVEAVSQTCFGNKNRKIQIYNISAAANRETHNEEKKKKESLGNYSSSFQSTMLTRGAREIVDL